MQLVILDRDGVIDVGIGDTTASEHAWQAVPGSLEALARLSGAGYRLVVVSNQSEIRRKSDSIEILNSIHHNMQRDLLEAGGGFDAVFFCSCPAREECDCMMPNPGMLLDIAARLRMSLADVPVIASSMATVEAARAAGARPVFVGNGDDVDEQAAECRDNFERYTDLAAAVDSLLAETAPS